MNKQDFNYIAKDKGGNVIRSFSFSSDNPYKDLAKYINEESVSNGDVYVSCYDANNSNYYEHYRVAKRNPKFINHINGNFPKEYIDFNIEPRYLTCVDAAANHYKYYQIEIDEKGFKQNPDKLGTHVTYGRIGGSDDSRFGDQNYDYPINMFWIKYYEKISKGYIDQTELKDFSKPSLTSDNSVPDKLTENDKINKVFKNLIDHQRTFVQQNYDTKVPFSQVAIEKTEELLKDMTKLVTDKRRTSENFVPLFVSKYETLISILPRKISDVKTVLEGISMLESFDDDKAREALSKILEKEQDKFDVFKSYVSNVKIDKDNSKNSPFFQKYNLAFEDISYKEIFQVQDLLQENAYKASNIIKITNTKTEDKYNKCCQDMHIDKKGRHLLWHGSRTENWWSICSNGLSLNPNAITTGKMFGRGLYFAERSQKSMGYTDSKGSYWAKGNNELGYLALYEVAMGKSYNPRSSLSSSYNFNSLPSGYQSVWAYASQTGLRNNECIIYKEDQCTIRYLVETSTARTKDYDFNLKDIRKLTFGDLKYDKDNNSFYARVNNNVLSDFPSGTKFIYHPDTKQLGVHNGKKYYGFELEALSCVFKNHYADNEKEFTAYMNNVTNKSKDTTSQIQFSNPLDDIGVSLG